MAAQIDKEKVKRFLSKGISPSVVANMVGCEPSYITELMGNEEFKAEVQEKIKDTSEGAIKQDELVNKIRGQALEQLGRLLPFMNKAQDLLRVFEVMDKAKSLTGAGDFNPNRESHVVNINLPQSRHINYLLSSQGEVIEVNGRSMIRAQQPQILEMINQSQLPKLENKLDSQNENSFAAQAQRITNSPSPDLVSEIIQASEPAFQSQSGK